MRATQRQLLRSTVLYDLYDEVWVDGNAPPVRMVSAYNKDGDYIGDERAAKLLCDRHGIAPVMRDRGHSVCTIGVDCYGSWYGWSHRALSRFETRAEAEAFAEDVS